METILQIPGIVWLVELFIKSSLILASALLFVTLARKQSASVRHLVLGLAMAGILLLPLLQVLFPGWETGVLPQLEPAPDEPVTIMLTKKQVAGGKLLLTSETKVSEAAATGETTWTVAPAGASDHGFLGKYGIILLWSLGICLMSARTIHGLYGARRLTRRSVSLKGYPWQQLFKLFLEKMHLGRRVRILKNSGVTVPMTWGALHPVVVMPPDSAQWPVEQCSSVLFHELSHIKRWDFAVTLVARVSCSLYWFNPLSYLALRRLNKEQEKACDEMVLNAGIKPSTYASALLRMKQTLDQARPLPVAALGMASHSEIFERLSTILAPPLNHKEIKMKTKIILSLVAFLAVAFIATAKPAVSAAGGNGDGTALLPDVEAYATATATATADVEVDEEKKEKKKVKKIKKVKKVKKVKAKKGKKMKFVKVHVDADCDVDVEKDIHIVYKGDSGKDEDKVFVMTSTEKDGEESETIHIYPAGSAGSHVKLKGGFLLVGKDGKTNKIKIDSKEGKEKIKKLLADKKGCTIKFKDGVLMLAKEGKHLDIDLIEAGDEDDMVWTTKKGHKKLIKIKELKGGNHKLFIEKKELGDEDELIFISEKGDKKLIKIKKIGDGEHKIIIDGKEIGDEDDLVFTTEKGNKKLIKIKEIKGGKHKIFIDDEDLDGEGALIKINEGDDKFIIHADTMSFDSSKPGQSHMKMKIYAKAKLAEKIIDKLKKAVKSLQKDLPKNYKVASKITAELQDITVDGPFSGKAGKNQKKVHDRIKVFEEQLKKLIPGLEGKKKIRKDIHINVEEEDEKK